MGFCPPPHSNHSRRPRRRCRRGGGGGNGEGCRGGKSICCALKHYYCFRDAPGCRASFEGTWTPSARQVFRTYRRCSGDGAYAAGYSLPRWVPRWRICRRPSGRQKMRAAGRMVASRCASAEPSGGITSSVSPAPTAPTIGTKNLSGTWSPRAFKRHATSGGAAKRIILSCPTLCQDIHPHVCGTTEVFQFVMLSCQKECTNYQALSESPLEVCISTRRVATLCLSFHRF